jgi:hypothetical protein
VILSKLTEWALLMVGGLWAATLHTKLIRRTLDGMFRAHFQRAATLRFYRGVPDPEHQVTFSR